MLYQKQFLADHLYIEYNNSLINTEIKWIMFCYRHPFADRQSRGYKIHANV